MSATRIRTRALIAAGRGSEQCLRKAFAPLPAAPSRALLSTRSRIHIPTTSSRSRRILGPGQGRFLGPSRRMFSATTAALHGHIDTPKAGEELYVTFIDKEGDEHKLAVNKGDNLLTIAQSFDIEMEGACEGSCSCSTCHVIVEDEAMYDKMEEATDDENDMLDLAFGLTETSRLGCQIVMTKELDGLRVRLPSMTRNLQASDFDKKN